MFQTMIRPPPWCFCQHKYLKSTNFSYTALQVLPKSPTLTLKKEIYPSLTIKLSVGVRREKM